MSFTYDLVLVGTGFASSFFLKKYLEKAASTTQVLVLERGRLRPFADRLQAHRSNPNESGINWKESQAAFFNKNPDKLWVFDPNFGGSSNCWTGCTPRFMPNDFKLKTTYGVGVDWPISYDDLEPYYTEAEEIMMISGPEHTPFPKSRPYPLPPHSLSTADKLLQNKYGTGYISQPTARASKSTGTRGACCSSAVCSLCPVNAKFTIENGLASVFKDPRVTLEFDAQVFSMQTAANAVQSVQYQQAGQTIEARAEVVALGANALFNAHILLNSGDTLAMTGKGLTEQLGMYLMVYLDGLENVGGGSIIPANGYMLYDGPHRKEAGAILIESHNTPYIRSEKGKWRQIMRLKFAAEDLPDNENQVVKTENLLKPATVYRKPTAYATKAFENLQEKATAILSPLPVEKIVPDGYFQSSEYHICSTHRMGIDEADSVVDKNLLHHRYRNLFVLGSGAYPTISPANPTLTLSALSLMAADRVF